jgi:hypothetical protein
MSHLSSNERLFFWLYNLLAEFSEDTCETEPSIKFTIHFLKTY